MIDPKASAAARQVRIARAREHADNLDPVIGRLGADGVTQVGLIDHDHERNGHHQRGTAGPGHQCCTIHCHLAAVLPLDMTADLSGRAKASLELPLFGLLVGADPSLPDRTPKPPLSV